MGGFSVCPRFDEFSGQNRTETRVTGLRSGFDDDGTDSQPASFQFLDPPGFTRHRRAFRDQRASLTEQPIKTAATITNAIHELATAPMIAAVASRAGPLSDAGWKYSTSACEITELCGTKLGSDQLS